MNTLFKLLSAVLMAYAIYQIKHDSIMTVDVITWVCLFAFTGICNISLNISSLADAIEKSRGDK